MSFLAKETNQRATRPRQILFSFLPLVKIYQIINHSKYIQKDLSISIDNYKVFMYIKNLIPSMKKSFNLKHFEKCEKLIKSHYKDVSSVIITDLVYQMIIQYYNLVCTSIKPDRILKHLCGVQWITQNEQTHQLISCTDDNIRFWDLSTYECVRHVHNDEHSKFLRAVYLLNDHNYLLSISYDMKVVLWNLKENTSKLLFDETELICCIYQLKNKKIVLGCEDSKLKIYDCYTKEIEDKLEGSSGAIRCMCELDDNRLVTGGLFAEISIWNLSKKVLEAVLLGHNGTIQVLTQFSNGNLVSGSGDYTIRIWNMKNNSEKQTLIGHKDVIRGIIERKKYKNQLISVSEDNVIKLWNMITGKIIFSLIHCHQDILYSCVCLPDGRVVSCSKDTTIKIWNIDSIVDFFRRANFPIHFAKEKEQRDSSQNITYYIKDNESKKITITHLSQPKKLSEQIRRKYDYLPFAVINEQSASY